MVCSFVGSVFHMVFRWDPNTLASVRQPKQIMATFLLIQLTDALNLMDQRGGSLEGVLYLIMNLPEITFGSFDVDKSGNRFYSFGILILQAYYFHTFNAFLSPSRMKHLKRWADTGDQTALADYVNRFLPGDIGAVGNFVNCGSNCSDNFFSELRVDWFISELVVNIFLGRKENIPSKEVLIKVLKHNKLFAASTLAFD